MSTPLLDVSHVGMTYVVGGLLARRVVRAVDGVSLRIEAGRPEILAVIGESGLGQDHARAHDFEPRAADRRLDPLSRHRRDAHPQQSRADGLHAAGAADLPEPVRGVQPVEAARPLSVRVRRRFAHARGAEVESAADRALHQVGLSLAEVKGRFPHEMSGGQLQRIAIARALISSPSLIVADEPVSMVDASLRMSIVNLFKALRDELKVSIVYITHDLATAYYISDRVLIMQRGRAVESGVAREVLANPQHPYSILLKNSVLAPEDAGKPLTLNTSGVT